MIITSFILAVTMQDKPYEAILHEMIAGLGHWPPTDEELPDIQAVVHEYCRDNNIQFTVPYRKV